VALPKEDVAALKRALVSGRPVGVAFTVYQTNADNPRYLSHGEVVLPLPGELPIGAHAVILVGFRDHPAVPGGGHFVFRNSWGKSWAVRNEFAPGYGYLPYEYVHRFCLEAFGIDALLRPEPNGPGETGNPSARPTPPPGAD
jgi:C1A family cysteine protease